MKLTLYELNILQGLLENEIDFLEVIEDEDEKKQYEEKLIVSKNLLKRMKKNLNKKLKEIKKEN